MPWEIRLYFRKKQIPHTEGMGIRDHFLYRIDDSWKRDAKTEDLFSGNLRFQEKIINFLTNFGEIGGTSGKTKLHSFIFYNVSGQIQKKDAKMISGDIQSDGKPIIRSGTQRSGSAATGGLHLSEIPQKPRFEKFSGGVGHGWETQVQVGDNIRIGYRSMGTNITENLIPVFLFHFFICQSLMLHSSSIYSYIFRKIVSFIRIRLNYNMISREMLKISVYAISINSVHRKAYYWERSER